MDHLINSLNFSISITGQLFSILGFFISLYIRNVGKLLKRYFLVFFAILFLYSFFNSLTYVSWAFLGPKYTDLSQISLFFESFFSSLLMPLLAMMLIYSSGDRLRCPLIYVTFTLWFVYLTLLVITQFTTFIYYYTDDNEYHRGPLYPLLLVPSILIMATLLIGLIRRKDRLSKKRFFAILSFIIIPIIGMLLQSLVYGIYFIIFSTIVSSAILFFSIITDQFDLILEQQKEINRQQANILVLQMRPHFIYNTLSSIYYLCVLDPKKAQQTIGNFNTYLRKNMSAITKDELVPFDEELEHAKAYLAVEKSRYEKLLFVEYETEYTSFSLPPLTLQPIVENAVKHGVDPELPPLHITIKTEEKDNMNIITVKDTGPGYKTASEESNDPHIGITNITKRLALMCNGTILFSPGKEGGTTVTISIPK